MKKNLSDKQIYTYFYLFHNINTMKTPTRFFQYFEKHPFILFCMLLISLYFILDFHHILFLRPQGIHFIRQTDGLSFVANYYKNGFHFFEPQVFNLQSTDGKAASEFPILYYLTALSYLLFGEHEFILRLLTLSIVSIGFFFLFKLLILLLKDTFYALTFCFLFISSTVLLYYSNNFLPDASAIGFTLMAWYYFFAYQEVQSNKKLVWSFVFFTLAALLKVTFFIHPIAALLTLLTTDFTVLKNPLKSIKKNARVLTLFTLNLLLVLAWNIYVYDYNLTNNNSYFLAHPLPIWDMTQTEIDIVWDHMHYYWYNKYYFQSTFHLFALLTLGTLCFYKKTNRFFSLSTLYLTLGSISYFFLFFAQFKYHDYYFITLIPALIFIVINGFMAFQNKWPSILKSTVPKLILGTICILSLNYGASKLKARYENKEDIAEIGAVLAGAKNSIDKANISSKAKFIVVGDQSPNGGLYFIQHQGWSVPDTSEESQNIIRKSIIDGAEYIVFKNEKFKISKFSRHKIKTDKNALIFRLQP